MNNRIRRVQYYLNYLITARHSKGSGIHSPFVYEFVSKVLFDDTDYPEYNFFREIRNELKNSEEILSIETLDAGSDKFKSGTQKVKDILNKSSVPPKFGKLLFRIAKYYNPSTIVELGTSIGMSTIYLAKGVPEARIATIEGNMHVCEFARIFFKKHQAANVKAINGQFDDYLPYFEKNYPIPGLVFIDGNHTYESTIKYFDHFSRMVKEGFLIFDDINWSPEMRQAWEEIKISSEAQVTIDLFSMGIVIHQKSITPGHFMIRF